MKKISIVVPMYNEQEVAAICYDRLTQVLTKLDKYSYEIVFVNDGSKDKTLKILEVIAQKDKNVKIISFSRNFGQQAATMAGMRATTGEAVVVIDSDMQDPPEVIPDMIELWNKGNDVVYAVRKSRSGETKFKLWTSAAFYRMLSKFSDTSIPLDTGDFRLMDRKVVDVLAGFTENNKFFRGLVSWVGFKQIPYEYERQERVAGETKWPFKKLFKLALDAIITFSSKPLKIIGSIGFLCIFISIALLIYALLSYAFHWNYLAPGWTSIMVTLTFMFGVQFLTTWMLAEYVSRIYDEVRHRPEYIIEKTKNLDK